MMLDAFAPTAQMIAQINPLGNRWTSVFNAASQPIATIDPLGNRATTTFDATGQTIAVPEQKWVI